MPEPVAEVEIEKRNNEPGPQADERGRQRELELEPPVHLGQLADLIPGGRRHSLPRRGAGRFHSMKRDRREERQRARRPERPSQRQPGAPGQEVKEVRQRASQHGAHDRRQEKHGEGPAEEIRARFGARLAHHDGGDGEPEDRHDHAGDECREEQPFRRGEGPLE